MTEILESLRAQASVPGFAAVVMTSSGAYAAAATGRRRIGSSDPLLTTHRFHIGSISKSISSAAIGALVEQGTLSWDTPALDAFSGEHSDARYRTVTVRQLLSHTAGVAPFEEDADFEKAPALKGDGTATRAAFARWLLTQPPIASPGTQHIYSNAGYAMAASIAERATGQSFEAIVNGSVIAPLGLQSAGVGLPGAHSNTEPWGHSFDGAGQIVEHDPAVPYRFADLLLPAGGYHMTLLDLARFGRAHLLGLEGQRGFLEPSTIRDIHTEVLDGYALGWNVRTAYDSHLGGLENIHTAILFLFKAESRVYALAVNIELDDVSIFGQAISQLRKLPIP